MVDNTRVSAFPEGPTVAWASFPTPSKISAAFLRRYLAKYLIDSSYKRDSMARRKSLTQVARTHEKYLCNYRGCPFCPMIKRGE